MGVEMRAKRPETAGLRINLETMERAKENLNKRPDEKIFERQKRVQARKEFKKNLRQINQQHKQLEENGPNYIRFDKRNQKSPLKR